MNTTLKKRILLLLLITGVILSVLIIRLAFVML